MKKTLTIELSAFIDHTGMEFQEDLYANIYVPDIDVSLDDIVHNMPRQKEEVITKELLESNSLLREAVQRAYNRAYESGVLGACYRAQIKACEEFCDELVDLVNMVALDESEDAPKALESIVIDWPTESVCITYDDAAALYTTRMIINGEGVFGYDTDEELAANGGVAGHLHYLLNGKLINNIYGFSRRTPVVEYDCDDCDFDENYFDECIDEELAEIDPESEREHAQASVLKVQSEVFALRALNLIKK